MVSKVLAKKLPAKALKRPANKVADKAVAPTPPSNSKTGKFAAEAEVAGWEVDRLTDGDRKTARCVRGDETVEVNWTREVAEGPIGNHSYPGGTSSIKNAASALRIINGKPGEHIPNPKAKAIRSQTSHKPRATRAAPLSIDPYGATDSEIINAVRGHKIVWTNSLAPDDPDTGYVPLEVETRMVKGRVIEQTCPVTITQSKSEDTLGERMLNFCDPEVGFRAVFVGAIIRIGG